MCGNYSSISRNLVSTWIFSTPFSDSEFSSRTSMYNPIFSNPMYGLSEAIVAMPAGLSISTDEIYLSSYFDLLILYTVSGSLALT